MTTEAVAIEKARSAERQRTMRVLAGSAESELADMWRLWSGRARVERVRGPEVGLVMVQGRAGGSGTRFNLGEASVTRATVLVRSIPESSAEGESLGTAYVLGSCPDKAELAAIFDGLLGSVYRQEVLEQVISVLEKRQADRDSAQRAEAGSTVVDFFTVARENDVEDQED